MPRFQGWKQQAGENRVDARRAIRCTDMLHMDAVSASVRNRKRSCLHSRCLVDQSQLPVQPRQWGPNRSRAAMGIDHLQPQCQAPPTFRRVLLFRPTPDACPAGLRRAGAGGLRLGALVVRHRALLRARN
eukprot:2457198-Pleurochrysis_carterae.AAC.1